MFLNHYGNIHVIYFSSYRDSNGYVRPKAFNSCGIKVFERAYDNNGLYIVIRSKKVKVSFFTSVHRNGNSYPNIMKDYIFKNIIEESLRGTIIPI